MKRRTFLTFCSSTGLAPVIGSWASSPNETPNIASVGVGGKGWADANGAAAFSNMQAFCDVNQGRTKRKPTPDRAKALPGRQKRRPSGKQRPRNRI